MLSFSQLHEATNTHLQHVEDLIFINGISGARSIFAYIAATRDMVKGHAPKAINISQKWDGAPSIVAGYDPADGKFFVAKKGVFNKTPIVYKSHGEIDASVSGDLNELFHVAFDALRAVKINTTAIQGDFLFTSNRLKQITIEGESYVAFHPNTIVYAVPSNSGLADDIYRAEMGVVWHTSYSGKSLTQLSARYNAHITGSLSKSSSVWMVDAVFQNQAGFATMTAKQTAIVNANLSQAGRILNTIPSKQLNAIGVNDRALETVLQFNNSAVRAGDWLASPSRMAIRLMDYAHSNLTTPKGKLALQPIAEMGLSNLAAVYSFVAEITKAKILLTQQLDKLSMTGTFVQTSEGYRVTTTEGYVAADILSNQAVKLVDRLEFSAHNFSPDIIKGWS